ncbi:hypothetical protein ABW19_dt0201031 [Dactylella cylindrospora]|nr:hypothetical protein ABW19_dt0201031 [Dactylella cylindrospora]
MVTIPISPGCDKEHLAALQTQISNLKRDFDDLQTQEIRNSVFVANWMNEQEDKAKDAAGIIEGLEKRIMALEETLGSMRQGHGREPKSEKEEKMRLIEMKRNELKKKIEMLEEIIDVSQER